MSTQKVTGLVSGFDTSSIVESLMKLERQPYEKLDIKKQTEQLKLQAYQAVNTYLLKFRTSVSSLASSKLWNSKACVSTNEKSITATANEYAVKGSYSFKVAQLATATQYMSKGFSSSKTSLGQVAEGEDNKKLGTINLASSKTRVDNSAKLDTLNGGSGIFRGSIRVTDRSNSTSVIDLSSCDTMDDVVRTINESSNAQITASIKDGRLYIKDESGGIGTLKVQNVGAGSTATDLGIAGVSEPNEDYLHGRNVYTLGEDMSLKLLNDGLGVEEGQFALRVSDASSYLDLIVDVDGCSSVGDVIKRVNEAMQSAIDKGTVDEYGGGKAADLLDGMTFGISSDKRSFGFTGVKDDHSYLFYDGHDGISVAQQTPAAQLGLHGNRQTATTGQQEVSFGRVLGDVNSPMLKNLSGATSDGIGSPTVIPTKFSMDTLLSDLNGGKGLDISRPMQIQIWEGSKGESAGVTPRIIEDLFSPSELQDLLDGNVTGYDGGGSGKPTVADLQNYMNDKIAEYAANPDNNAAGLTGMQFGVDVYNNRFFVANAQSGYTIEIGGSMAANLGLSRASGSQSAPAIETADDAVKTVVKDFYAGVDSLVGDNNAFNFDPAKGAVTTLKDLTGWHSLASSDTAGIQSFLDSFKAGGLTMDVDGTTVNVDLTGITFDPDMEVQDFMDSVNGAIQDSFDAVFGTAYPGRVSAPKLSVHTLQDQFQWTNVDFSKEWTMSGSGLAGLGLDKTTVGATDGINSAIHFDINPGIIGSVVTKNVDSNTTLDELNLGLGITLAGEPDDTIEIEIGDGKKVTVALQDLRDRMSTYTQPWKLDDYVAELNSLVNNGANGLNALYGAQVEFGVENNQLVARNFIGVDYLNIAGTAATSLRTGLSAGKLENIETGKSYTITELNAADVTRETVDGLGEIHFKFGTDDVVLKTGGANGLTTDSTLNDLIDRLNEELQSQGINDLKDVRFTINSSGTGIAIENNSNRRITFQDTGTAETLAQDLGLVDADGAGMRVESYTFKNAASLGRNYISRATELSDYLGSSAVPGTIQITNTQGKVYNFDLSNCKTIGDVLDFINDLSEATPPSGIYAQINERGDGITFIEAYPAGKVPPASERTGNISIKDLDSGNTAKKLGIAGTGNRDKAEYQGNSVFEGSLSTSIDVMASDTLESIMYRISEAGYKTAIVNDGSSTNPYRLTISSSSTGEANDFVIESDMDIFGFNQTSRAKDAKVLYGDPNSNASPVLLSSSTNSNSNAILGLTLDLKQASTEWTTITVDTDKDKVKETITAMVESYNELADIITMLDAYDAETGEPGVLFGDTSCRKLMDDINEIFYAIFNPNNQKIGSLDENGKQNTWTWMDLGISLSAKNTNSDGTGSWYTTMELDLDKLDDMVASNWDVLSTMLSNQRNASNSTLGDNVKASSSFNGALADGFEEDGAINGDSNRGNWGVGNGIMAAGTIADGNNEYTIWFQKPTTMTRMSIYHYDSATALKNFTVEYLDANTGKWEILRDIESNASDANHLGMALPTSVSAIRIKADSTNATDGKFRLLDVQVYEETGLAGKLNQLTTLLGDTQTGFLAERNTEVTSSIKDIEEQMSRLQERLTAKEESLWRRFTAMETAMGKMQNQSSYFSSMMDSMGSSSK